MKPAQKVYAKTAKLRFRETPNASGTDNVIRELPEGQEMSIIDGPWVKVKIGRTEGWVHGDYITETPPPDAPRAPDGAVTHTVPLVIGVANLANDLKTTIAIRAAINDEFHNGAAGDNLQCTEYVAYRVLEKLGITIQWPVKSGRNGGKWASIFQKYGTYPVRALPARYAAMSFTAGISTDPKTNEIGHVAFVEAVLPDGSIRISEVNLPHNGIYNERTLSKADWQGKYKAAFTLFA